MSPKRTYQILLAQCSGMNPAVFTSITSSTYSFPFHYSLLIYAITCAKYYVTIEIVDVPTADELN